MRVPHLVPNKHRPLNKEEKSTQKVSGGLFESTQKVKVLHLLFGYFLKASKQVEDRPSH